MNREQTYADTAVSGCNTETISIGLEEVDRRLGGGIPAGSVAVLVGTPTSSSELLCHQFATTHASDGESSETRSPAGSRDVFYVTTDAPTRNAVPDRDGISHFHDLPIAISELAEQVGKNQESGDQHSVLIVDRFSDLLNDEEEPDWFADFTALSEEVTAGNTAALVHLHVPDGRPLTPTEARVLSMADAVFNYDSKREESRADRLYISKVRGAAPPENQFVLEIGDQLTTNPDQQV